MQPTYPLILTREQFAVTKDSIYLNHAGIGPVPEVTRRAVEETLTTLMDFHGLGKIFGERIPSTRRIIANMIHAQPEEVAFAQNTADGMNLVAHSLPLQPGDNVLVCNQEYPAVAYPFMNLDKRRGIETRVLPHDGGGMTVELLERHADSHTRVVAVSSVEFATGFRTDLKAIGEWCKAHKVWFVVDGIQSLGAAPMDVKDYSIDMLASGGHKWMLAPAGQGFLYVSSERLDELHPPFSGASSVANAGNYLEYDLAPAKGTLRYETGSLNLMGVAGLGASVDFLQSLGIENIQAWTLHLTDLLLNALDREGYQPLVNRDPTHRSAIIIFKGPEGVGTEAMSKRLSAARIMHSVRGGGIRIAPHCYNTEDEVLSVVDCLHGV